MPAFLAAGNYDVTSPAAVVTADFNNDGHLDLATLNLDLATYNRSVSVLLGNGDGSFPEVPLLPSGRGGYDVAAADFNGDGQLDLATAKYNEHTIGLFLAVSQIVCGAQAQPASAKAGNSVEIVTFACVQFTRS